MQTDDKAHQTVLTNRMILILTLNFAKTFWQTEENSLKNEVTWLSL
jgi:hypothetical protein